MLQVNFMKLIASLSKWIASVFKIYSSNVADAVAIESLKNLESICISFNILPNGFAQNPIITPSRWTKIKSICYLSLITIHIIHLAMLSVFDLPEEWLLVLGDFLHDHPNRRYFWILWLNASILSEILRHYWIFLMKSGNFATLKLYHNIYINGFNSNNLSMDQFCCQKFRLVATNLINVSIWVVYCMTIGLAPILIFIVHSDPQLPRTYTQFIYTNFWLFVNYLGIVFTIDNIALSGSIVNVHLSYFYIRAGHVAQTVKDLAAKRGKLNNVDYLRDYKAIVNEIIKYQNEIERLNIQLRNWVIFLYFGISFTADFGVYIAAFVHIERYMDIFMLIIASIVFVCIGTCSYINGIILTKMNFNCKNLRKVARCLNLSVRGCIKGIYLQDRLSRTDAAFTIGKLLDVTTRVFVIYLIENICLVMMFKVNFK